MASFSAPSAGSRQNGIEDGDSRSSDTHSTNIQPRKTMKMVRKCAYQTGRGLASAHKLYREIDPAYSTATVKKHPKLHQDSCVAALERHCDLHSQVLVDRYTQSCPRSETYSSQWVKFVKKQRTRIAIALPETPINDSNNNPTSKGKHRILIIPAAPEKVTDYDMRPGCRKKVHGDGDGKEKGESRDVPSSPEPRSILHILGKLSSKYLGIEEYSL